MNSPFPGMDPFVEMLVWTDFHSRFNPICSDLIAPQLEPRYYVAVEERVYIERFDGSEVFSRRPDAVIAHAGGPPVSTEEQEAEAVAVLEPDEAVECLLQYEEEVTEPYLVIKQAETHEIVTVIETLSPSNKRSGTVGHQEYLAKRDQLLHSTAHFVELDLLRGGERPPVSRGRPQGDYFVLISEFERRPRALFHAWRLRQRMPTVRIPLLDGESVSLNVQEAFNTVYERARYHLRIDYTTPLDPPVSEADADWIKSITNN
jgi:hypothetical protein